MDIDALTAGVEPGGLTNRTEIRLLICYLIKSIDRPISKQQLSEIIQSEGIANYFEVIQALNDLVSGGNISCELNGEEEILSLSEKGLEAASSLEMDFLPKTVREKAINSAIRLLTKAKREQENKILVEKLESGYNVTFILGDEKEVLMKLTVFVADEMQVETVKKNFIEDPVKLYSGIIASLTV